MCPLNRRAREKRSGAIWGAVVLAAGVLLPVVGAAEDCQIPLFIKQYAADANVMILMDSSGSMNEVILHEDYDPDVTYAGPFERDAVYYITKDGLRSPNDFHYTLPSSPEVYLVNSDNGEDGRYWGNYLNWIYYHADEFQRSTVPTITRIQVAKVILSQVITLSPNLRFGITVYQNNEGGNIVGPIGKSHVALQSIIAGITANTWTPTGEAMEDVLDYFSDTGPDACIQEPCMYNFLIVMTDGYPTMDTNVSSYLHDADGDGDDPGNCASIGAPYDEYNQCSDHMDDVAYYMRHTDLRPDMDEPGAAGEPIQFVYTYTIGYAIDAELLEDTAINGGGLYYVANNALQLLRAFEAAIQDILMRISSGSAVAVVSTERGDSDRLFRGKFMPGSWDGYLECYALPYEDGDAAVWEAGSILHDRSPASRDIYTAFGETELPFSEGIVNDLAPRMGLADPAQAEKVIHWVRGEYVPGLRDRHGWILGDIVHSTPVIVGPPSTFRPEQAYQEFYAYNQNREKIIYVGSNDGMLHAFRAEDGHEMWALVPEGSLPKLPAIADTAYCHQYTCDATVSVQDVKMGGVWRTVLVTGFREGGPGLFAVDVTDPYAMPPDVLWQAELPDGKPFTSSVEFATIGERTLVLVGSGFDDVDGRAWLYGFDLATGNLLGSELLSEDYKRRNKATAPRVVDVDLDGDTDVVYVGDLQGHLWRFETEGGMDPGSWSRTELFAGDQPIMAAPTPAFGPNNHVYVYFGTGVYIEDDDMVLADDNSFYCVFDTHDGATRTRGDLVDQTDGDRDIGTAEGWYLDLWHAAGERVIEQAAVVAEKVFFTSFVPGMEPCTAGGQSWMYRVAYDDGALPEDPEGEDDGYDTRDVDLGDGVASRPVVDIVNESVIIQSSDASIDIEEIGGTYFHLNVRAWQENYDFVDETPSYPDIQ